MKRVLLLSLFWAFAVAAPFSSFAANGQDADAGIAVASTNVARTLEDLFYYEYFDGRCVADRHNQISFPDSVPRGERYFFFDLGSVEIEDCGSYVVEMRATATLYANSKNVDTSGDTTVVTIGSWTYRIGSYPVNRMKATGLYVTPVSIETTWATNYRFPLTNFTPNPYAKNPFTYDVLSQFFTGCLEFESFCYSKGLTSAMFSSPHHQQWATYDYDGGGVPDIDEWLRGTDYTDVFDDYGEVTREDDDGTTQYWCHDHKRWYEVNCPECDATGCICGACCSDKCTCGHWTGDKCDETDGEGGCACHEAEHTCADSCVHCCADCAACATLTVADHEAYHRACDETDGSGGHSCHEPEHTCGAHCIHCCLPLDACDACAQMTSAEHVAYHGSCNGTNGEGGCVCHDGMEEETCVCADYCCADVCACLAHADGSPHGTHGNGLTTCDGTDGPNGCSHHGSGGDGEENCICASYCCAHTCNCPAHTDGSPHGAHKNGLAACDGTDGSAGCSCHASTEDEGPYPEMPSYGDPTNTEAKFIDRYAVSPRLERLRAALDQKFGLSTALGKLTGIETTTAPYCEIDLPLNFGAIRIDFAALSDYAIFETLRFVLAALVWWELFLIVFNSLRKLL